MILLPIVLRSEVFEIEQYRHSWRALASLRVRRILWRWKLEQCVHVMRDLLRWEVMEGERRRIVIAWCCYGNDAQEMFSPICIHSVDRSPFHTLFSLFIPFIQCYVWLCDSTSFYLVNSNMKWSSLWLSLNPVARKTITLSEVNWRDFIFPIGFPLSLLSSRDSFPIFLFSAMKIVSMEMESNPSLHLLLSSSLFLFLFSHSQKLTTRSNMTG